MSRPGLHGGAAGVDGEFGASSLRAAVRRDSARTHPKSMSNVLQISLPKLEHSNPDLTTAVFGSTRRSTSLHTPSFCRSGIFRSGGFFPFGGPGPSTSQAWIYLRASQSSLVDRTKLAGFLSAVSETTRDRRETTRDRRRER